MKFVVDNNIAFIGGVLEPFAQVCYLKGTDIAAADVADAQAIVVRTRTICDAKLLEGSAVELIATATIGTDHIDAAYCAQRGICVEAAAGCNARAVAQWVFAAIDATKATGVLGIIGVGNVGSEVEAMAKERAMSVLRCDPPRSARGEPGFVGMAELVRKSDIITVHVPLDGSTANMIDADFLELMRPSALLLNSSRGEVAVEQAMIEAKMNRATIGYAIDVWRNEPLLNERLMAIATIATPHIAGYSARGKAKATEMAVRAIAKHFDIEPLLEWSPEGEFALEQAASFDIMAVDKALRATPAAFESLRTIRC